MRKLFNEEHEALMIGIGLVAFIAICLFLSWLGEKMHESKDYYGGHGSYLEKACRGCDQQ